MNILINGSQGRPLMIIDCERPEGKQLLQIPAERILNHSLLNMCTTKETEFLEQYRGQQFVLWNSMDQWHCQSGHNKVFELVARKRNLVLKLTN